MFPGWRRCSCSPAICEAVKGYLAKLDRTDLTERDLTRLSREPAARECFCRGRCSRMSKPTEREAKRAKVIHNSP
jgi:hypothetical protein